MARKRATLTDLLNDLTFRTIYHKFKLVAVNAFQWEGLPDGVEERYIERKLFEHGKVFFFRDPGMDLMCLEAHDTGRYNVYGEPLAYNVQGFGYNKIYNADEGVLIENNKLRLPTEPFVMHYTNKLTEAERTMDVNVKANKTPFIFTCDDKDVLTFKRIFQQVDGNVPAIFADRGLNLDSVAIFQTGVKFLCNDLTDYANSIENKLLTFLGVNNSAVDKKERLITDEANANNQLIESFSDLQLEARQRACDQINEMFGLSVSVRRRQPDETEEVTEDVPDDGTV